MGKPHRMEDLEVEESLEFQRAEWRVERIGWIAMGIVIVVAALGFFGGAGIFETRSISGDHVEFQFDRFARFQSGAMLHFEIEPGATNADTVAVWISRAYMESVSVNSITPTPRSVDAAPDRYVYTFSLARPGASIGITFHLTTQTIGSQNGQAGLVSGRPLYFSQFTYP